MATKHCGHCKQEKDIAQFNKDKQMTLGLSSWCKSCRRITSRKQRENPAFVKRCRETATVYASSHKAEIRNYQKQHYYTPQGSYTRYKSEARTRKIAWQLTFDQFMEFWQKPCYYCGDSIDTVGLDRFHNSVGYTNANVVPCCSFCNSAKNKHSYEMFLHKINKIHQKHLTGVFNGHP